MLVNGTEIRLQHKPTLIERLFGSKEEKHSLSHATEAVVRELAKLNDRMSIPAVFEDFATDFVVGQNFEQVVAEIAKGAIFIRTHYTSEHVKCVHNKWEKDAFLIPHYHSNADEYLYVTNGAVYVELYDEDGNITEKRTVTHRDSQPIVIPKGVRHFVKAVKRNTNFVVRFEF